MSHTNNLQRDIYSVVCWGLWHINRCRLFNAKFSLYKILNRDLVWLSIWHINHSLFNVKFSLYMYIKYI